MPRKISLPDEEVLEEGRVQIRTDQWLKRRSTKAIPPDDIERECGYIELRDFRGRFDLPLSRDDVLFIVRYYMAPNGERTNDKMLRFDRLVNLPGAEVSCLLLWLQKHGACYGESSLVDDAIDAVIAVGEKANDAGLSWSAKDVENLLEEIYGTRAGGWSHIVEEALRKIRKMAAAGRKYP